MKAGKVWGNTEFIFGNSALEFHKIEFTEGSTCSKHKHKHKWNGFYVTKGLLKIKVWKNDYDLIDETVLEPGEWTTVKPGEFHQFEGMTHGEAFELYWAEFDHNDIERETVGSK
jgi:quercetin dioxygenase-like cupin family protein